MRKYRTDFISSDGNVEVHYVLLREQFHCQQQTYNRVKLYTNETLHWEEDQRGEGTSV